MLKAIGVGIAEGMRALEVSVAGDAAHARVVSAQRWFAGAADLRCQWITEIPGYMACVAFGDSVKREVGADRADCLVASVTSIGMS